MRDEHPKREQLPFGYALLILSVSFLVILLPTLLLQTKVQPLFFLAWTASFLLLRGKGYPFEALQTGMTDSCKKAVSPILILFCSGAMIGAWNQCGAIPFMTAVGVSIIRAQWYLPVAFCVVLLFAFLTGTVFGACGTVGAVLLATGRSMGFPAQLCVGAVTAGGFLGYALSPAADCTNAAASLAGVDLMKSIQYQGRMTGPAAVLCAVMYGVLNRLVPLEGGTGAGGEAFYQELTVSMRLGWPALLPLVLVVVLLVKRQPTVITLASGALAGVLLSLFYQRVSVKQAVQALWEGGNFSDWTGDLLRVFETGGIKSMADTAILFVFAFALFGLFESGGVTEAVLGPLLNWADQSWKGDLVTVLAGFVTNLISASGMCSFIFTASCLAPIYAKRGWNRLDLVRSAFVGCLFMSLWIPWHSNVITPAALMGVEDGQAGFLTAVPALILLCYILLEALSYGRRRGAKK